jgi:threonine dehydrogenase-like Zn-dependent dehydrogenase
MQGIWLDRGQLHLRHDLPQPQPAAGEALVKVLQAGICNTDLELMRGYYPFTGVLGHEFVGVVVAGAPELLNHRVVGEINAACGKCRFCLRGIPTHCEHRTVLGIVDRQGAFAEYLTLPVANLHPIPESVSTTQATFIEPLAAALQIQTQVNIDANTRVVTIGDGKLGQLIAQTLSLTGCELLAVGKHADKLNRLAALGINTGFAEDIQPRSYQVAIDCTGNPAGFELARQALEPRGTLVMKSTYAGNLTIDASALVVDEISVIGSRCGPFPPAIDLLATGKIDPTPLVAATYHLADGIQAFDRAQTKGCLKVLLDIGR